jgi:ribosomal protein S18
MGMKMTLSNFGRVSAVVCAVAAASGSLAGTATVAELKTIYGPNLEVLGDVQQIDLAKGVLTVAGQHIAISKETRFTHQGAAVEASGALRAIALGDLLAVSGELGEPATNIDRASESYLPGATTTFVKGKVEAVDASLGVARIDELRVDVTPAMSDIRFQAIEPGQVVEAVGMRPSASGPMLAYEVVPTAITETTVAAPSAITGTAKVAPSAITGTAVVAPLAITGTAKVAPSAITGTAKVAPSAITGTAVVAPLAITGTAKVAPSAITGTAKVAPSAITGTAVVAPLAITGTAKVAPSAITGTAKVAPSAITGTA